MYFSKRTVSLTLSLSFLVAGPKSYDVVSDDIKNRIFEITRANGLAFDNIQNGMLTDRQYFMKIQYLFN